MGQLFAVMIGGAFGAAARFVAGKLLLICCGKAFPYGTLFVNVVGSFLIGYLSIYLADKVKLEPILKLTLMVGFLGAFTTFSTFSLETLQLLQSGQVIKALVNIFLNIVCCLTAVWVGVILAR